MVGASNPRPASPFVPSKFIPSKRAGQLLTAGALGIAVTTALEVVTAPYGAAVAFYPANGVVHVVKVLAALCFVVGALATWALLRHRLGRVGRLALPVLARVTLLGAVPYSVAEALLDPGLPPAEANTRLEAVYDQHVWIGTVASVAMPLLLFGIIALAVSVLRRHALPAWAPWLSLAAVPVAVAAGAIGASGTVPVPHPPAWIFLGLAAYGLALRSTEAERVSAAQPVNARGRSRVGR